MPIIMMEDRIEICLGYNVESAQCGMDSGVCEGCEVFFTRIKLVAERGFEPPVPCAQDKCLPGLGHSATILNP
jgi:hypothetical protein